MLSKSALHHPLRTAGRFLWLSLEIVRAAMDYFFNVGCRRGAPSARMRALWLHRSSRRLLRACGASVAARGPIPCTGLLVSNHLTYLDVAVLASLTPAVFVSKIEVRGWPVFGRCARWGGTIFVHRGKRLDVARVIAEIEAVAAGGVLVVLFPEGTSSDGRRVLPFKPSLIEPATATHRALSVARIGYELADGDPGEDVCYWRDMVFFPHLINLLSKRVIAASVCFKAIESRAADRKALAVQLRAVITKLRCGPGDIESVELPPADDLKARPAGLG